MNVLRKVLVATDGSSRVLAHAAAFARSCRGEVVLLRVIDAEEEVAAEPGESPEHAADRTVEEARQDLTATLAREGVAGVALAVLRPDKEEWAATILRVAADIDATLIAMDSHAHATVHHVLHGSVAMGVLSMTNRPLMLGGPELESVPVGDVYRVVVASDGSEASGEVVRALAPVIDGGRFAVTLMQVVESRPVEPGGLNPVTVAEGRLRELRALLPPSLPVEAFVRAVPPFGGVDTAIVEKARQAGAKAIALSTHGHSARRHLVAGSTALTLLGRSPLPVILARANG